MYSYKDYYADKISAKKYLISKLKTYICTDIYDSTMIKETMQTAELTPCTESKFPLVEGIRFFHDRKTGLYYFNASEPLLCADNASLSIEGFFSRLDCLITPLIETHGLEREILSVKDGSGEVYLEECLVIPFMTYVEPWFGPYMILRMEELLSLGVTLSDEMTRLLYQARFGQ